MKILLSPAKLMSLNNEGNWKKNTSPQFLNRSEVLMEELKKLNAEELQKLMKISKNLADLNIERNMNWKINPKNNTGKQSALIFDGEVFKGLNASNLNEQSQEYLNENLMILSGLYGILRPSDKIMPYRLEMGTKFSVEGNKNLYEFWKDELTNFINSKLKKDEVLLNLASVEYSKVLDDNKLKSPKIEVDFLDFKDGKLKKIMVYFKHARGLMARYCAKNKIQTLDELKLFNEGNYSFDDNLSTDRKLVFIR